MVMCGMHRPTRLHPTNRQALQGQMTNASEEPCMRAQGQQTPNSRCNTHKSGVPRGDANRPRNATVFRNPQREEARVQSHLHRNFGNYVKVIYSAVIQTNRRRAKQVRRTASAKAASPKLSCYASYPKVEAWFAFKELVRSSHLPFQFRLLQSLLQLRLHLLGALLLLRSPHAGAGG